MNQKHIEERQMIEEYLGSRWEFRFNELKQALEWKPLGSGEFLPMDDYRLNSIQRALELSGTLIRADRLDRILHSEFVQKVNPVAEYLNRLHFGGTDRIGELVSTLTVENPEHLRDYLTRWLIACVANALTEEGCQNHLCLVLSGPQGAYKTTWLNTLCPPALTDYLYCGRVSPDNKDSLQLMAQCFLINIDDQLRNLNQRDENSLKGLITAPEVKYRQPYGRFVTRRPRLASFMGSVNGADFLTDPTGSRRFLPFEVQAIDIEKAKRLNMDAIWAQAVHYYRTGVRYWFSTDEITTLYRNNEAFTLHSAERELLAEYFAPEDRETATLHYTSSRIKAHLEMNTGQKLSAKRLGEALRELGFSRWQKRDGNTRHWVWSVREKPAYEREGAFLQKDSPSDWTRETGT